MRRLLFTLLAAAFFGGATGISVVEALAFDDEPEFLPPQATLSDALHIGGISIRPNL